MLGHKLHTDLVLVDLSDKYCGDSDSVFGFVRPFHFIQLDFKTASYQYPGLHVSTIRCMPNLLLFQLADGLVSLASDVFIATQVEALLRMWVRIRSVSQLSENTRHFALWSYILESAHTQSGLFPTSASGGGQ